MQNSSCAESTETMEVTVTVPINIALIKYWGKRDQELKLPLNDSISVNINDLCAKTTVRIASSIDQDSITINGQRVDLSKDERFLKCFAEVRRIIRKRSIKGDGDTQSDKQCFHKFEISSETNFPIEAGLASSAAGFAAIAFAFGHLYKLSNDLVLQIARLGSGSACRSLYEGFVHWKVGRSSDGSDCTCETIAPADKWNSLRALILVTSSKSKHVGSTKGMQRSVETSELLKYRVEEVVPKRVTRLIKAIQSNDFDELATVTMGDSNQLHAICLDTAPPLKYLNEKSWHLIRVMEALNAQYDRKRVAYTFDAGPNCCLFFEGDFLATLLAVLVKYCDISAHLFDKVAKNALFEENSKLRNEIEKLKATVTLNDVEPKCVLEDMFLSGVGAPPKVVKA